MWMHAAGLKSLGGYYHPAGPNRPDTYLCEVSPAKTFMLVPPRPIQLRQEHINTKEMWAVEQGLLRWGRIWKGAWVITHINNQAVVHGIANQTIRGNTMDVLHRCLLLASKNDIEFHPCRIPTEENILAEALSPFNREAVANLAQQRSPLFAQRLQGILTSETQD